MGSLKAITTDSIASECVLKSVEDGGIEMVNKSDAVQLTQFGAYFIGNPDQEISCNFATFVPSEEDAPLKRAEWIKYLGTFFNLEARANLIFNAVKENYNCLSKVAGNNINSFKPVVAWLQFSEGIWSFTEAAYKLQVRPQTIERDILVEGYKHHALMPIYRRHPRPFTGKGYSRSRHGHSRRPFQPYPFLGNMAVVVTREQYVIDAGGENLDDSINRNTYNISVPDDLEAFHAILCTVDVVIDETYAPQPEEYTLSSFLTNINIEDQDCFTFISNQSLWRYDKRAHTSNSTTLDFFDGAVSQPQLVLADLIEAFFPTRNHTTTYFRNIVKGEEVVGIGSQMCQRNSSIAMDPTIVPCTQPS